METTYTDRQGIAHDIELYTTEYHEEIVYVIHRNGHHFLDLTKDEDGTWIEVRGGPSERAAEYGIMIDDLFQPNTINR